MTRKFDNRNVEVSGLFLFSIFVPFFLCSGGIFYSIPRVCIAEDCTSCF